MHIRSDATRTSLFTFVALVAMLSGMPAQDGAAKGGSVTGGSAAGGTVTGGSVTGGSVTGGSVTGGSVTGGSVTGGSATGGSVTGGTVTPGKVTSGTATAGVVGASTATATVNGRQITATADGSVSVKPDGANAVVSIGGHTLLVEKERLVLDGEECAKLSAATTKVGIEMGNGNLTVRADGKEVLRASRPKAGNPK